MLSNVVHRNLCHVLSIYINKYMLYHVLSWGSNFSFGYDRILLCCKVHQGRVGHATFSPRHHRSVGIELLNS